MKPRLRLVSSSGDFNSYTLSFKGMRTLFSVGGHMAYAHGYARALQIRLAEALLAVTPQH